MVAIQSNAGRPAGVEAGSGREDPSLADRLIGELDTALRVLAAPARAGRPGPAAPEGTPLPEAEQRRSAALMRINHAGEVAAQALYRGQACFARQPALRSDLLRAAGEEHDHLAWCEQRLRQLGARPSRFNPIWYSGAFALGAAAGLAGKRCSLGFLAETERQVAAHLENHLTRLPADDALSRAILEQMRQEEIGHGHRAQEQGGMMLPAPVRTAMRLASQVMIAVSGWR